MALYNVFQAAQLFLSLISSAIFFYVILTWVAPRSALCYWLERFINPFCAPFRPIGRAICMRWGSPFDFTCWLAIIGLRIVSRLLDVVFVWLVRLF